MSAPDTAPTALRPARARVDLSRLAANYAAVRAFAGVPVMPVVKADAYGHGAVAVVRRLLAAGAERLAVAYPEEGVELRRAGVAAPVVVLSGFTPEQAALIVDHALTPVVSTPGTLEAILEAAGGASEGPPFPVHLKLDTGMARLGFRVEAFGEAAVRLADSGRIEVDGLLTHLANADEDADSTRRQLDAFDAAVAALQARGIRPRWVHACNSAGLAFLRPGHTLVRPGLLLYGLRPRPLSPDIDVRPVMTVSGDVAYLKDVPAGTPVSYGSRWVAARPSRIATIPLGYADGVPRTDAMRETGAYVVRGARVPIVGTVCMDLTMADVTDHAAVAEGDEAVLFGDAPDAWELARCAGTNAWDVLTRIGPRVPRVYVEDGRVVGVASKFLP